jgi:hypothetical protein
VVLVFPFAHIPSRFAEDGRRGYDIHAVNLGEVRPGDAKQLGAQGECWLIPFLPQKSSLPHLLGQTSPLAPILPLLEILLELAIALCHLLLAKLLVWVDWGYSGLAANSRFNCYLIDYAQLAENEKVNDFDGVSASSTTSARLYRCQRVLRVKLSPLRFCLRPTQHILPAASRRLHKSVRSVKTSIQIDLDLIMGKLYRETRHFRFDCAGLQFLIGVANLAGRRLNLEKNDRVIDPQAAKRGTATAAITSGAPPLYNRSTTAREWLLR